MGVASVGLGTEAGTPRTSGRGGGSLGAEAPCGPPCSMTGSCTAVAARDGHAKAHWCVVMATPRVGTGTGIARIPCREVGWLEAEASS